MGVSTKAAAMAAILTLAFAGPATAEEARAPLTAEETANIATVEAFVAAWNAKDQAKMLSFFADDARFSTGLPGKTPEWRRPEYLGKVISDAVSVRMTITPGTTWARGPVVTHERTDDLVLKDRRIQGVYVGVFTLRDGKIVDFLDFDR